MNYRKHYNRLIKRARNRILEGYVEKHHVIPKCMNGTDDFSNIVVLTPEEHFLAHLLLIKMYPDEYKLVYAAKIMTVSKHGQHRNNNKLYGWLKRKHVKETRPRKQRAKETKPRKTRVLSEEHKRKIGLATLGRPVSEETRKKLSLSNIRTKALNRAII